MAATPELSPSIEPSATNDGSWLLLLSGRMTPSESGVHATSERLEAVASHFGGEYDGREAELLE